MQLISTLPGQSPAAPTYGEVGLVAAEFRHHRSPEILRGLRTGWAVEQVLV